MKFSAFMTFNAIVALVFGIAFVLVPEPSLAFFGLGAGSERELIARFVGVEMLVPGLLCWFARNISDPLGKRAIIMAQFISTAVGFIVSLLGITSGLFSAMGWVAVGVYMILALGYAYFGFLKPDAP